MEPPAARRGAASAPLVFTFHNTGLYNLPGPVSYPSDNTGLYEQTGRSQDVGKFRMLQPLTLTADERKDLIAFLESLTDREALRDPRWSDPWN